MSLSIIIPANNEGRYIDACLVALLASAGPANAQVIVAANGCTDDTVARARAHAPAFSQCGWQLEVLDLPGLGKMAALDAGDAAARHTNRAYLDADVIVSPPLMGQIDAALAVAAPRYASGTPNVTAVSPVSRAFGRMWSALPFVAQGVPGFGLYCVNGAGRARWAKFPAIISDDTWARIHFTPEERVRLPAPYDWPLVEGFGHLVRVRRRQDQGVSELQALVPDLMANEGKDAPGKAWLMRRALKDPLAFAVYAAVKIAVRAGWGGQTGWVRGR